MTSTPASRLDPFLNYCVSLPQNQQWGRVAFGYCVGLGAGFYWHLRGWGSDDEVVLVRRQPAVEPSVEPFVESPFPAVA